MTDADADPCHNFLGQQFMLLPVLWLPSDSIRPFSFPCLELTLYTLLAATLEHGKHGKTFFFGAN